MAQTHYTVLAGQTVCHCRVNIHDDVLSMTLKEFDTYRLKQQMRSMVVEWRF